MKVTKTYFTMLLLGFFGTVLFLRDIAIFARGGKSHLLGYKRSNKIVGDNNISKINYDIIRLTERLRMMEDVVAKIELDHKSNHEQDLLNSKSIRNDHSHTHYRKPFFSKSKIFNRKPIRRIKILKDRAPANSIINNSEDSQMESSSSNSVEHVKIPQQTIAPGPFFRPIFTPLTLNAPIRFPFNESSKMTFFTPNRRRPFIKNVRPIQFHEPLRIDMKQRDKNLENNQIIVPQELETEPIIKDEPLGASNQAPSQESINHSPDDVIKIRKFNKLDDFLDFHVRMIKKLPLKKYDNAETETMNVSEIPKYLEMNDSEKKPDTPNTAQDQRTLIKKDQENTFNNINDKETNDEMELIIKNEIDQMKKYFGKASNAHEKTRDIMDDDNLPIARKVQKENRFNNIDMNLQNEALTSESSSNKTNTVVKSKISDSIKDSHELKSESPLDVSNGVSEKDDNRINTDSMLDFNKFKYGKKNHDEEHLDQLNTKKLESFKGFLGYDVDSEKNTNSKEDKSMYPTKLDDKINTNDLFNFSKKKKVSVDDDLQKPTDQLDI